MIPRGYLFRPVRAGDYEYVVERIDGWWNGRPMTAKLPRLFFEHFPATTVVAESEEAGLPAGFLCGFRSGAADDLSYIHFVGVDPEHRRAGLGRGLYQWFFGRARELGCDRVGCVTSPSNGDSRAFHAAMGFADRIVADYDGPGETRVVFERALDPFP